jgi:hypothetical protein
MNYEMEKVELSNGKKITIDYDENAENPRMWDNITQMICFHRRYDLGDSHSYNADDYSGWDEMEEAIVKREKPLIIEPLYMYDHSGMTIATTPFGCNWDSGQIGFVMITPKNVDEFELTLKNDETYDEYLSRLLKRLEDDVRVYDDYITGNVYGYTIESKEGDHIDSCSGFYGDNYEKSGLIEYLSYELTKEELEEFKNKSLVSF